MTQWTQLYAGWYDFQVFTMICIPVAAVFFALMYYLFYRKTHPDSFSRFALKPVIFVGLVACFTPLWIRGCENETRTKAYINNSATNIASFFGSDKSLHRFAPYDNQEGKINGSGFFIFGTGVIEINGVNKTVPSVKFAWNSNDGFLINSTLPLSRARVVLSENVQAPKVRFILNQKKMLGDERTSHFWNHPGYLYEQFNDSYQNIIDQYMTFAVITVRPDQWPAQFTQPF
ncbi:MAG: hypothetical protein A3J47_03075 [Candidatus Yanofskybacteria bacterium RIFCSPHIGHO2_02_FULL_43_22]|uniref:Uncharacterized protein n=1 Tax=Candidatus Yanofskybacteria bacterium RIFCSPHIGHO2_02_FULL_43_22 TaxID=1802681 RepID=A0A1F8FLP5_9BACT|nr:MAG: hypothetical protein A3J47_03075 [Candidatus Yanofskybacteria bacterium RIFCSPHIGHO2_02_FULL_43_22]